MNGNGTLLALLAFLGGLEGPAERTVRGGGGGVPSSTSPSSGDDVACRFEGRESGVRGAGRFEGDTSMTSPQSAVRAAEDEYKAACRREGECSERSEYAAAKPCFGPYHTSALKLRNTHSSSAAVATLAKPRTKAPTQYKRCQLERSQEYGSPY